MTTAVAIEVPEPTVIPDGPGGPDAWRALAVSILNLQMMTVVHYLPKHFRVSRFNADWICDGSHLHLLRVMRTTCKRMSAGPGDLLAELKLTAVARTNHTDGITVPSTSVIAGLDGQLINLSDCRERDKKTGAVISDGHNLLPAMQYTGLLHLESALQMMVMNHMPLPLGGPPAHDCAVCGSDLDVAMDA